MFVVRGLIGTTIKPLLARYIKGNVQIPSSSESTFELNNIELKQDALEELLSNKIHVEHASATSLRVNITTAGIELLWGHIQIKIGELQPKQTAVDPLTGSTLALGSSLAASASTSEIVSSLILPNLVEKIDGVTNSIHHFIPLITVETKTANLTLANAKFNTVTGLRVESAEIFNTSNQLVGKASNIAMTLDLKITIDLLSGDFEKAKVLLSSIGQKEGNNKIGLSIQIKHLSFIGPFGLTIDATNVSADEESVEIEKVTANSRLGGVQVLKATSITAKLFKRDPTVATFSAATSGVPNLIDTETIFMFHDQSRSPPIASDERTTRYREHAFEMADVAIRVACTNLNVNLAKLISLIQSKDKSSSLTALAFAIDLDVEEQLTLVLPIGGEAETTLTANTVNFFVDLDAQANVNWYFDATKVVTPFAIGTALKAAGSSNQQIGLNMQSLNVLDVVQVEQLKRLIPPVDPNADPFNICIHIDKGKIAPSELVLPTTDIRFSGLDVFTLSTSGDVVVVAAAINTTHLRATGFQILLAPSSTQVRLMVLQVLSDQAHFDSILTRLSKIPSSGGADADPKPFNLSDHKVVKRYSQTEPKSVINRDTDSIRVSIGKILIQQTESAPIAVTTQIDGFKFRKNDARMLARFERLLISTSTLKRAVLVKNVAFTVIGNKHDYVLHFADTRENPVILDLDQAFVDYLSSLSVSTTGEGPFERDVEPIIVRSLKVSAIKLRVSFKPGDATPISTTAVPQFLRWVPIRDAAIKIGTFECFGMDVNDIGVAFGMHIISDKKNLARLAGGVQLIKAPAEIMKNLTELILVPISPNTSNADILSRVQGVSAKTVVSVLNVGASGSQIQPTGIKEGMIQAGQVFQRDMNTVIAFIGGDNKEPVDVSSLPMMMLRPLTSPMSKLLSGVCNQLGEYLRSRIKNSFELAKTNSTTVLDPKRRTF